MNLTFQGKARTACVNFLALRRLSGDVGDRHANIALTIPMQQIFYKKIRETLVGMNIAT